MADKFETRYVEDCNQGPYLNMFQNCRSQGFFCKKESLCEDLSEEYVVWLKTRDSTSSNDILFTTIRMMEILEIGGNPQVVNYELTNEYKHLSCIGSPCAAGSLQIIAEYCVLNNLSILSDIDLSESCFSDFFISKKISDDKCAQFTNHEIKLLTGIDIDELAGTASRYCNFLINDSLRIVYEFESTEYAHLKDLYNKVELVFKTHLLCEDSEEEHRIVYNSVASSPYSSFLHELSCLVLNLIRPSSIDSETSGSVSSDCYLAILENLRDYGIIDKSAIGAEDINRVSFILPSELGIENRIAYEQWLSGSHDGDSYKELPFFAVRFRELIESNEMPSNNFEEMKNLWSDYYETGGEYTATVLESIRDYAIINELELPAVCSYDDSKFIEYLTSKNVESHGFVRLTPVDIRSISGVDLRNDLGSEYRSGLKSINSSLSKIQIFMNYTGSGNLSGLCTQSQLIFKPFHKILGGSEEVIIDYTSIFHNQCHELLKHVIDIVRGARSSHMGTLLENACLNNPHVAIVINELIENKLVNYSDIEYLQQWRDVVDDMMSVLDPLGITIEDLDLVYVKVPELTEEDSLFDMSAVRSAQNDLMETIQIVNSSQEPDSALSSNEYEVDSTEGKTFREAILQLSDEYRRYLVACLTGEGMSDFTTMRELLESQINREMCRLYGDSIVENGEVFEDYEYLLEEILNVE